MFIDLLFCFSLVGRRLCEGLSLGVVDLELSG